MYMDDWNIQPGHRNGIWYCKMRHVHNEKWKRETAGEIELPNQKKN